MAGFAFNSFPPTQSAYIGKIEHDTYVKGISQLYEYRYLENTPAAKLVLVIERPIIAPNNWMNEYLEDDRDVLLVWDGHDRLFGSAKASAALPFLYLNQ